MSEIYLSVRIKRRSSSLLFRASAIAACAAAAGAGLAVPATASQVTIGALTAAPANQAAQSAVGLAFDSTGSGYGFYRGVDKAVYMRTFAGTAGTWSAQKGVGGVIIGAPAAAVARTTVVVAARGSDNALWVRMMHNGAWGRWTNWGGALSSSPAVAGGSDGRIDVFARGMDKALWTRTLKAGGSLTAWKSRGGKLTTAPAAVTISDDSFEVAAAGTDHAVWTTSATSTSKWRSLGGRTYSAPAIGYIPQSNGAYYLVRGTDNALWANGVGGGDSTGWKPLGGRTLIDGPTAAGTREPSPSMIATIRRSDKAVWKTTYPTGSGGWGDFTRVWIPA